MTWNYGNQYTYQAARQEVINRMATICQPLPPGVTPGHLAGVSHRRNLPLRPESPQGRVRPGRFTRSTTSRRCKTGCWSVSSGTVPRIVDVTSFGGTVRRYEVQPDPDRLRRYGITLGQLQTTLDQQQRHRGRRLPQPGPGRHDRAERRAVRRRPGPGEQGAGIEEPAPPPPSILRARSCGGSATSAAWSSPRSTTSRSASKTWSREDGSPRTSCPASRASSSATRRGWGGSVTGRPTASGRRARPSRWPTSATTRTTRCSASCSCARAKTRCPP